MESLNDMHAEPAAGAQAGAQRAARRHYRLPSERAFTRAERGRVTLLFGGLTRRHELLLQAAVEGLGHKVALLPTPTRPDYQAGREYCNRGQCNPSYFTVGALINFLKSLRDREGVPLETIIDDYVLVTAGSCGPCRFGMYESEYRLGLRNSGFEGFRVVQFGQYGLNQSSPNAGLDFDIPFFIGLLNAIFIGDLLNELANRIRPYEIMPGQTEHVFEGVVKRVREVLRAESAAPHGGHLLVSGLLSILLPRYSRDDRARLVQQVMDDEYVRVLRDCAHMIDEGIEVDYTRPKPLCKIIGEFWAQTTEGDGNFRMFSFLESQGMEVLADPITGWAAYLIEQERSLLKDTRGFDANGEVPGSLRARLNTIKSRGWRQCQLGLAAWALRHEYERDRAALGGVASPLLDQRELQRLAHPYYNRKTSGGEGHLEVAKNIYYASNRKAHMILSLKPFGCLPSTQSDGVQAAVTARHPGVVFLPIETSGENEIGAHSRVQMAAGEAKVRCREELASCTAASGYSIEDIRSYCAEHRELRRPLQAIPARPGVAGLAANFVLHVGTLMDAEGPRVPRSRRP